MDRLETNDDNNFGLSLYLFTFQYGQIRNPNNAVEIALLFWIYIPVWIDQKHYLQQHTKCQAEIFTFQYGQIRNVLLFVIFSVLFCIYIPVWIDQKHISTCSVVSSNSYLHSSMDRLETNYRKYKGLNLPIFTFQYGQIRN